MAGFSLQDEASLIMTPNFITSDTLVSIKPEDDSGNFAFSRGTDITATRVNSSGLIEKGYENKMLNSNDFARSDSSYEITNGEAGYDGTNDAWLVNKLAAAYFGKNSLVLAGVMTISFFAKAGSLDRIFVFISGEAASFDLTNGTAVSAGGNPVSQNIELVSGTTDWYRCSIVINKTSTQNLLIKPQNSSNQDVTGTIYIQDAMLNQGLVAMPYLETTTAAVSGGIGVNQPRLDYSGGATCPSVLLEPSRTNLVGYSEYFGGYTNSNSTDEANATTSPEGLINATSFLEAATTGQHKLFTSVIFDGSSNYTFSIFAKSNGRDLYVDTQNSNEWGGKAWFDLTAGTANAILGTADIEDFGNGWYRCIVTGASTLSGGNFVELLTSDGSTNSTTGDITKGVYIYGAMVESNASYPSSYIPTYGAAATRTGDVATSTTSVASTGSLSISLGKQQEPYFTLLGESFQAAALVNNIAIAYSPTALKVSINGAIVVNATGTYDTSSLSSLQLGHLNGADQMGGGVKDLIMFNDFLSDTELNALTV